ncbi:helix-turn-helix transcriptional regulator [Halorussus gelatinilyticus]|uniref:Helix-turn-helix transcriptional regulator n=1 Tax=Halorussus gelatinilyticus TaxID=2937524 RepID=A0A8U0IK62_9EURY|nr:helix-turn-helix domain-containing protein [Halorussus gelatinilyticus]UPW01527.1 helix-turn-helix transcriptional regulator [Halorussus gelatinilyticus]
MTDDATPDDFAADDIACYCRLDGVLDLLSRKYAMQVLCVVAATDPTRFGELEEFLPDASTSTLSARLDELAGADLLTRTQYDEIPPRVEYELTDDGRELATRLEPVLEWAEERDGRDPDGRDPDGSAADAPEPAASGEN